MVFKRKIHILMSALLLGISAAVPGMAFGPAVVRQAGTRLLPVLRPLLDLLGTTRSAHNRAGLPPLSSFAKPLSSSAGVYSGNRIFDWLEALIKNRAESMQISQELHAIKNVKGDQHKAIKDLLKRRAILDREAYTIRVQLKDDQGKE